MQKGRKCVEAEGLPPNMMNVISMVGTPLFIKTIMWHNDWALSLKCEIPNSNLFIILVLVLNILIWKRLPKEMFVFFEVHFVNEFQ